MRKKIAWGIAGILVLGGALWGSIMSSNVEQAPYIVTDKQDNIEIRQYPALIVAEVSVSGDRKTAIKKGFRLIADYIFGNNIAAQKVAMTAPVTQQENNHKIAMTAPVIQTGEGETWVVRFVMPQNYTIESLPKPVNDVVQLKGIPNSRYAVIRFSGMAGDETLKKHRLELESFIQKNHFKPISQAIYAFFNPPWTLPFLRRNEIMIQIEDLTGAKNR